MKTTLIDEDEQLKGTLRYGYEFRPLGLGGGAAAAEPEPEGLDAFQTDTFQNDSFQ